MQEWNVVVSIALILLKMSSSQMKKHFCSTLPTENSGTNLNLDCHLLHQANMDKRSMCGEECPKGEKQNSSSSRKSSKYPTIRSVWNPGCSRLQIVCFSLSG